MANQLDPGIIAEYEAIFTYGDSGPHLSDELADVARESERRHRDLRDRVTGWLSQQNVEAPAMQPVYTLPVEPVDADTAVEAITLAEQRCAQAWRSVLADTEGEARRVAVEALAESAVAGARWRRALGESPSTVPFPGRSR
ncbi:uncharacterized protein DUF4439 [Stackebrandtia endophytica]|uniref:Uncharacterized protein DUF4439 n=1 Tax=Stackebrandtia endophytica TaxID=1496996 RepID=A0A543B1Q0_9ACTN|nr:ferritin-like domain-containing protein [Stackebrandtia endophytica]TQL78736.1 uncharacterized protein DUF4439 [Stackebrandtia endophytica]